MQVTAEQTDPCTVVLDIQVDEQQVARAFDAAFREFGRHANVPGFRPGKAPRAIVERYVDGERVRRHTLEKLIRDTYPKAIEDQGITPYREPAIEPTDLEDKKPYAYKARIPLEPRVTIGSYKNLSVQKPIFRVTDELIAERIERLRTERARLDRITDRGVEHGDVLIAETQAIIIPEGGKEQSKGDDVEPPVPRRQLVQMGNNIPGYDEAVLGMMPGEERTFELTYPDDFEEEEKRGKPAEFTIKLNSISAKKLPELNDDFAAQVGIGNTIEELHEGIRERLKSETERISNEVAEQRLLEAILNDSEIHFPEILVRDEVEDKLRQLSEELRQHRMPYAQYLKQIGRSADEHQAQIAEQAEAQIRTLLALREIALQENLQTDNDAVDNEFTRMSIEGVLSPEQVEEYRADQRRRLQVANALIQQQLHDFLFANNNIEDVAQVDPPDAEDLADAREDLNEEDPNDVVSGEDSEEVEASK